MPSASKSLLGAVLAIGLASAAMALSIYNNGVPDAVYGTAMTEFQVAENFRFATAYGVTSLRFWRIRNNAAACSGGVCWAV